MCMELHAHCVPLDCSMIRAPTSPTNSSILQTKKNTHTHIHFSSFPSPNPMPQLKTSGFLAATWVLAGFGEVSSEERFLAGRGVSSDSGGMLRGVGGGRNQEGREGRN